MPDEVDDQKRVGRPSRLHSPRYSGQGAVEICFPDITAGTGCQCDPRDGRAPGQDVGNHAGAFIGSWQLLAYHPLAEAMQSWSARLDVVGVANGEEKGLESYLCERGAG
jgi:hypothetical protein